MKGVAEQKEEITGEETRKQEEKTAKEAFKAKEQFVGKLIDTYCPTAGG